MLIEAKNNNSLETGNNFFIAMFLKQLQELKVPAIVN